MSQRLFIVLFNPLLSPPQPVGLRNRNAATFGTLKKYASHFFNSLFVRTKPKEAANQVTGVN
jgi:hypothetical protein